MRKMKDSGIEWIGEIPEKWKLIKIKHIFDIGRGRVIAQHELEESGYPVYSSQTQNDGCLGYISTYDYDRSQLTWTTDGVNAGTVFLREGKHNCTNVCGTLTPKDDCNNLKYLKYALEYIAIFHKRADTNGYKIMNNEMAEISITIPSKETQDLIADYLDQKCAEIDAIIAAKEKTNELLKERRQSIIYEAVTKGLDPTVPMKDSGVEWIGEIPMDWDVCPVKYLIDKSHPYPVGDGDHGMIKADDYLDEGIPYIRVLNLTWGEGLNLENLVYISEEMNSRIKNSELKPNDILIAKTGATIGKTAIVPDSLPRSNTTSHVGKITISSDHDSVFFYYVMTSSIVQKQIQDLSAMQSTRPELGIDGLRNLLVVVPPIGKQRDISEFLNQQCTEINAVIDTNSSMIDKLKEYRQSVIYEAVTGKIEIYEGEKTK